ncbi:MAG: VOC family protein [Candidatus Ancaeobacter aquaticus]|nr:VOC family protein [Candidatus Ancaeobacter aquaticus]
MIKGFRHVCLVVKDIDRSIEFYTKRLGFSLCKKVTVSGLYPDYLFQRKKVRLTYAKLHSPEQSKKSEPMFELHYWHNPRFRPRVTYDHIALTSSDLDNEYKRLKKCGLTFISKPKKAPHGGTKVCFGYDPDGHLIEFMEDIK